MASSTSPAVLYRVIDRFKGTLVIDEADFEKSEMWSEIVRILNAGYTRGMAVMRTDKTPEGTFEPMAFECFGPKILAGRRQFKDPALEDRCLTYRAPLLNPKAVPEDMPLTLGKEFRQQAQKIKNQLLLWRFRRWSTFAVNPTLRVPGVDLRMSQLVQPLRAIAADLPKVEQIIVDCAKALGTDQKTRTRESSTGHVVKALLKRWRYGRDLVEVPLGDVTRVARSLQDQAVEKPLGSKTVGAILRNELGIKTTRDSKDRDVVLTPKTTMQELADRYEIKLEELPELDPMVLETSLRPDLRLAVYDRDRLRRA